MKCLLDCDGVLADFHNGALKLHNIQDPYLDEKNLGKYGIEHMNGVNISLAQFYEGMNEEFWASLQPTSEFNDIIRIVEMKFGRENICLLTAPVETHGCLEGKRIWIQKHLPEYLNRFLIGKPKDFCASPHSVLIDDSETNTKDFRKAGGKTILVPRPWNCLYTYSRHPLLHIRDCLANL